jgi:hypothetical protein|tara:strand:+ start:950 stop:1168 length:219 start_codon:yes stop_codon:yes gene_type:complete
MIEVIIGFGVGCFLGRSISLLDRPQLDRLLVWDQDVFAWRGVPFGSRLDENKKYLAATEVILDNEEVDISEF